MGECCHESPYEGAKEMALGGGRSWTVQQPQQRSQPVPLGNLELEWPISVVRSWGKSLALVSLHWPAIGSGAIALSKEALFSQEKFLGEILLCPSSGQHLQHLGEGVSWPWRATWTVYHSIYYSSLLAHSDPLSSDIKFTLFGNMSSRILVASCQGRLTRGSLEDESQPPCCSLSQGHTEAHHFFPLLPIPHPQLALLQVKVAYLLELPRPSSMKGLNPWTPGPFSVCYCYIWPSKLGRRVPKDSLGDIWSEGNIPSLQARTCRPDVSRVVKMGDTTSPSRSLGVMVMGPPLLPPPWFQIHVFWYSSR